MKTVCNGGAGFRVDLRDHVGGGGVFGGTLVS